MPSRTPSLRSTLVAMMGLLVGLALATAIALFFLTTHLHKQMVEIGTNVASIRLAHEVEIDLLMHSRVRDPAVRAGIETDLRRSMATSRSYVTTRWEADLLAEVQGKISAYLAARSPDSDEALESAVAALERFVALNARQADRAEADAARWDRISNVIAIFVACALLAGVIGVIFWIRARVVRPILAMSAATRRFGQGRREERAPVAGPAEVRHMATTFNEMADAVQRQQREQFAFLAGVAHDLKNPLSALKLAVGALSPKHPLPPENRVRAVLGVVDRQVIRLHRMVGDFLDASRIESGRLDLRFEACDLRGVAAEATELFAAVSADHDVELRLPDLPVPLRCDPTRIAQVLNNLISNAIKYSPGGGSVTVSVRLEGEWVRLSVTDHGVGMSREEQAQIFTPFRRVGVSRETIPGVGLGLFVSRRIVEAHGGRLEVESKPGLGSTFHVRLPSDPRLVAQIYS